MRNKYNAFTLIELLIVVAIVAILAAIAVPNLSQARIRSKVAAAQAQIRTGISGLEAYRLDNHDELPPTRFFCFAMGAAGARDYFDYPWQVTTPVAYLSERPLDPFNKLSGASGSANALPIKYRRPGFGYFNDMPTEEGIWVPKAFPIDDGEYIFYNNASEKCPASASPVEYGVWSVGPIPKIEIELKTYEPVPSHTWYDPSNGTVSEGIIVQLSTGHHSP